MPRLNARSYWDGACDNGRLAWDIHKFYWEKRAKQDNLGPLVVGADRTLQPLRAANVQRDGLRSASVYGRSQIVRWRSVVHRLDAKVATVDAWRVPDAVQAGHEHAPLECHAQIVRVQRW